MKRRQGSAGALLLPAAPLAPCLPSACCLWRAQNSWALPAVAALQGEAPPAGRQSHFGSSLRALPPACPPARPPLLPQVTAMQIAALKRLGKGTTVYVMDRNGSTAKAGTWPRPPPTTAYLCYCLASAALAACFHTSGPFRSMPHATQAYVLVRGAAQCAGWLAELAPRLPLVLHRPACCAATLCAPPSLCPLQWPRSWPSAGLAAPMCWRAATRPGPTPS